ncbi:kinase-like domain-containing protein [Lipomyces tetrasporus]|uniref:Kinase-like domain-containing protein n=1 Tax=Lipomyces tetrasporus TaxID=54092 RepID=A0AAD7QM16_9ASCO|nr:kinase-like domain-containing protein [Lipomyces tetrasporus]KAJ8097678.1 kinase-like domain-containing protein [Lipomyces tetrasporus]
MSTSNQTESASEYESFFRYTSGRWVWGEDQQLRDRYKFFNVTELQNVAAEVVGSDSCVSMIKLAEGGYNKVFRLLMDDGKAVIARIPNPNAGPPFYTTASEVATMELVRTALQLPVPQVYGWSATSDNPVGSEYIIMEEAVGTQLGNSWDKLTPDSKLLIMKEVVSVETKLLSLSFSHYGNIYFASDAVKGAVSAEIVSDAPIELKEKVSKMFTIGPSVDRGFWNNERSMMNIDRGPWWNPMDYVMSIGRREIAWIEHYARPKASDDPLLVSTAQNTPEAHIQLLEKFLKVAPYLQCITAVIDWQGVWAGPLFLQARPSQLVDYQGRILLKRPAHFDDLDDEDKARIKRQISKSTLFQLYLMETEERNPELAKVFHLDHGKTRRLPVEFAGNTWDDDIVSFGEALINVERHWKELAIEGSCPIHFTEDELESHLQDAEGWNEVQDFFDSINGLVKRDGWTHHETFGDALEFFSSLRKVGLKDMKGKEREKFEKETRWAER